MTKNIDWNMQHKTAKAQSAGTISKYQAKRNTAYKLTTEQPELDAKGRKRVKEILAQYPMIIE
mgnify:FL=1